MSQKAIKNSMAVIKDYKKYASYASNGNFDAAKEYSKRMSDRRDGLNKELTYVRKFANKKRQKAGKSPTNYKKLENKMDSSIKKRVQRTFDSFPNKVKADYIKQMNPTPPPVAKQALSSRNNRVKPTIEKLKNFLSSLGELGTREIKIPKMSTPRHASRLKNFNTGKALNLGVPNEENYRPGTNAFDNLDIKSHDIHNDPNLSIFDILHLRYQKSPLNQ